MTGQVQGKVAIVTGGASGIGAACAELLAREGASVAVTDIDELRGPEVVARHQEGWRRGDIPPARRHQRTALDRGRGRGDEAPWPARRAGVERRHRHWGAVDHRDVAGRLAAADRGQSRWRIPFGEALSAGDAQDQRRLRDHDVITGGPARLSQSFRLLCDQGRRPPVCESDRDGMRDLQRRHPGQLGTSRHHRHADLGQDSRRERRRRDRTRRSIPRSARGFSRRSPAPATPWRSRKASCTSPPTHRAT